MTKKEVEKRIEKLKKVISYHRYLYHVLNQQEISDAALDSLKHELYKLEQQYPELITSDSPTQRIAGKPLEGFKKIKHKVPMLSMEDIFSERELEDWQNYLKRLEPNTLFEYFCEFKIDGFAITLVYKKGIFIYGATRGDGKIGEDVTQNLKTIESIPLKIQIHKGKFLSPEIKEKLEKLIKNGRIEIRGEVYMEKKDFEKVNQERKKQNLQSYANPRNTAAGAIRQLNSQITALRPLKFLAYDIVTDIGQKTHFQEHQTLPFLGFKTDNGRKCQNLKCIKQFWQEIVKKRDNLPFQIDGIVVNINNNSLFQKLGIAGKSSRGARAFKFSPEQSTTIIKEIKIQVGRTGAVTPIAVLKPVKVGGVTISRATLHNEDEIKKLGVRIGDTVIIERAGDVIPAVVKVLPKLRTGKEKIFQFPNYCPICKTKLIRPENEVVWRCPNTSCRDRKKKSLYYFASKKAFDINGLGPKIIEKLIDAGLISDPVDIFKLEIGDILPLESMPRRKPKAFLRGFAEKSAENLIEAIQKSKKIPLPIFIYSLGIRHVGEETAIDLAQYFGSIDKLKKAHKEELETIPDVGPEVSKSIYKWFREEKNKKLIEDFLKVGINILSPAKRSKKLAGKTFVLTGSLESLTRTEAKEKIRFSGGEISGSVSENTDFVVIGKEPGSKLKKAKELKIKIIKEKEFLKLIK